MTAGIVFFIISGVFTLGMCLVGGLYMSDRSGWNSTLKRVSKICRASIEHKRGVRLEVTAKVRKLEAAEWDAEFSGKPKPSEKVGSHRIVSLDFYSAYNGPWPEWRCSCGASNHLPTSGDLEHTQRRCAAEGAEHVRVMNNNEAKQTNPNFKF